MGQRKSRKPKPKPKPYLGDLTDPRGMAALVTRYLEALSVRNFSSQTVDHRTYDLGAFCQWCEERNLARAADITKPILERYQKHLYYFRREDGKPLSFRTQFNRLVAVRSFFKWLTRGNHILYNPASELDLPRLEHRLPKHVLTTDEAETILAVPDLGDPLGLRDRAMMETLYSTGMRRMELVGLKLLDLDVGRGTAAVHGKGKKDRTVPVGERALAWIDKYLREARPLLAVEPDEGFLFLTLHGEPLSENQLTRLVRNHIIKAGIGKRGSCHLFRHTMATLMLENGADIRFIQEILGHANLQTTEIYTRVSIRQLKEIHTATHPAAKLRSGDRGPLPVDRGPKEPGAEKQEPRTGDHHKLPEDRTPEDASREAEARKILSTLAAEAAEDPEEDEDPEDDEEPE